MGLQFSIFNNLSFNTASVIQVFLSSCAPLKSTPTIVRSAIALPPC